MEKKNFVDPLFQEILDSVPQRVKGEVDRSFDLASRIDGLLRKKGWTKTDLAKKTGKKCSEVTKWLSGTQNFTLRTIALIEEALGTNLISVLDGQDTDRAISVRYEIFVGSNLDEGQAWKQPRANSCQGRVLQTMNQWS